MDQKNRKAFLKGGDINFPGGAKIPLPGGIELPTTGPWSYLLDIPEVHLPRNNGHLQCFRLLLYRL